MLMEDEKCIFHRLLVESDQEEAEEVEDNDETFVVEFDESGESESDNEEKFDESETNGEWSTNIVANERWVFDDSRSGVDQLLMLGCSEPIHFYELFMTDIWDFIVTETNRYGEAKNKSWELTTVDEMKKFIGLCLQMGIVRLPRLRDYWSQSPAYGCNPIGSKVMARERFEKLLSHFHLADNATYDGQDNLYKVSSIIELMNRNFKGVYRPGRNVYLDECFVPFKGSATFRQYVPNKRHKYGVKLFKLCSKGGYTCRIMAYAGRNSRSSGVPDSVAIKLMDDLLDEGRHLYTDNRYTTVSLAESLIHRKTHLIGICEKVRKGLPNQIVHKKLRRGQLIALQNGNGVMALKWKNKADIIMLSTLHDATIVANSSRPQVVDSYNKGKFFSTTDQPASHSPYIRRSSKWYIRLFFNLVTNICLTNAWRIYCETVQKITINDFKIQVYSRLLCLEAETALTPSIDHFLEETPKKWRRCVGCYRKLTKRHDSLSASVRSKQVTTKCNQCNKYFCLNCFNIIHQKM